MMKLLFICTHNRCRSILAEVITRKISQGKIEVQSAGSAPAGDVHPLTLENLQRHGYETKGLSSQSWDDLGDFEPDVCITVCDNAAKEVCPMWLGDALKIHWGLSDPTSDKIKEGQHQASFDKVIQTLEKRIEKITEYDLDALSEDELCNVFNDIKKIN